MEDGCLKKVTETYVIDALSFGEAEKRILEEMTSYVSGEVEVCALKIAPYKEIFFADSNMDDKWYVAKLAFITIDEKTIVVCYCKGNFCHGKGRSGFRSVEDDISHAFGAEIL